MAFNGSGVYELPSPPTYPAVAGTTIRASYFNSTIQDLATALSLCWTRDGQSTATGTMNFLGVNMTGNLAVTGDATVSGTLTVAGRSVSTRQFAVGEYVLSASSTAPTGTISPNGGTIGNASSNASTRANADTSELFALLWASSTNTELPLKDSGGSNVARGVSAAVDFAANRQLTIPAIADGEALVAAVSSTVSTQTVGEVLSHGHTFTGTAVPDHTHTFGVWNIDGPDTSEPTGNGGGGRGISSPTSAAGGHTPAGSISSTGGTKNKSAGLFVKVYIAL